MLTAYTAADLAAFCVLDLGDLAGMLGWVPEDPRVQQAVAEATVAYGVTDLADATDMTQLWAAARWAIWRAAERATAGHYRFATDGQSFDRQQVWEHASAMVARYEAEAVAAGVPGIGAALVLIPVDQFDPYTYRPTDYWALP